MSLFTFEGDFEILADPQMKLVEGVLQKRGYKDGKVLVESVGQNGDNYIAHVKRFIYAAKDGSTFKMIGKIAPVGEELRIIMNTMILFNHEMIMYSVVLPKMNNIQHSAGVPENEKVKFPACYGVVSEAPFEFILLEDLTESGFEMLDKFQPLSNESVRLVMKDLARYHSLSYVLKNSEPETYKNITDKLINLWSILGDAPYTKQMFEMTENDFISLMGDSSEKYKKVINGSLTQLSAIAKKIESYDKGSNSSVIQHGDCWNNNILFRLENGKPVQDVMIDYQVSSEGNPAADILYLIFNCTDHAMRLKHYHEWIDYYHKTLDESLNNHGLKANRIFPKDQLDADLRRYGRIMVNISMMLISFISRESKDAINFKEMTGEMASTLEDTLVQMSSSSLDASRMMKLKDRIMGVIDTALEFGLLTI